MSPSFLHAPLAGALLLGLAAGCSSSGATGRPVADQVVTARDIERNPDRPIELIIQDKVPGVVVSRAADGSISLRIRGATSFDGTDGPLYILDDMPFEPGPGGVLTGVDPYSIQSIRVLKGAEAGIYGIRGFNGVIVITTRKPGGAGG